MNSRYFWSIGSPGDRMGILYTRCSQSWLVTCVWCWNGEDEMENLPTLTIINHHVFCFTFWRPFAQMPLSVHPSWILRLGGFLLSTDRWHQYLNRWKPISGKTSKIYFQEQTIEKVSTKRFCFWKHAKRYSSHGTNVAKCQKMMYMTNYEKHFPNCLN